MKPQPIATADVTQLSHDGRGIAHANGKTVFIAGAISGETVEYQVVKKHANYDEAKLISVLNASELRVDPICEHFGICGGCSLQHLKIEEQWQLKQKNLLEQIQHFGKTKPKHILNPLTASTSAYRHKARLGVKYDSKKDRMIIGFREKYSSFLTDIHHCAVLVKPIFEILEDFKSILIQLSIREQIPQIEIAVGEQHSVFILRNLKPCSDQDLNLLITFAEKYHIVLLMQPKGLDSIYSLFPKDFAMEINYELPEFNLNFQFKPWAFSQINPEINQQMVSKAIQLLALTTEDKVLDLFCGFGNFTLAIAKFVNEVIGVEGDAESVIQAKRNAELNQIANARFYSDNLFEPEKCGPWKNDNYTKILLDPPRSGALEILPLLKNKNITRVVYVSCNPATLARDIGILVNELGYHLESAGMMDMFPHTSHVESIALLVRK